MDPEHIPELKNWIEKVGSWDLRHFLVHNITAAQAMPIVAVLWPRLIEVDECVFIEYLFDEKSYQEWRREFGDDDDRRQDIEKMTNHLHLWDTFKIETEADYSLLKMIAPIMAEIWRAAAKAAFPDRVINVAVNAEDEEYGPTLVLYSETAGD